MRIKARAARELHGLSKSTEYRTWSGMRNRCFEPKVHAFRYYGARGITVCKAWRESFVAFLRDMGPKPPGRSIDRKNNDGNYSCGKCEECVARGWPANCWWATSAEQANNQRRPACLPRAGRQVEHDGRRMNLAAWARELGVDRSTLGKRSARGLSASALLEPTSMAAKRAKALAAIAASGGNKSQAAAALGIDRSTLYRILWRGEAA